MDINFSVFGLVCPLHPFSLALAHMDSQAGSLADTHLLPIDTEKTIGRRKRFRPKSHRSNTLR